jgi:hypothetical protein
MELEVTCPCGEVAHWDPNRETEADVHLHCDNCGALYAVSVTRIVDGSAV